MHVFIYIVFYLLDIRRTYVIGYDHDDIKDAIKQHIGEFDIGVST